VQQYADAGVTQLQLRVLVKDMPAELVMRSVELFGQHVRPRFR